MSDIKDISEAGTAIAEALAEYDQTIADITKQIVDEVASETVDELKKTSPKRTGSYRKNWTKKTAYENQRTKRTAVYNKDKYRITHLLEKGHDVKNKKGGAIIGYARPHPHIAAVEKEAIEKLQERIEAAVNK